MDDMTTVAVSSSSRNAQLSQTETPRVTLSSKSAGHSLKGVTQIHAAAVNGDKQTLSRLLSASTFELDNGDQFGRSPLMYCVLADRLECAELLIKAGAQVNLKDRGGRTALHWAAHKGNLRLMKVLLSRGADCREKDNEGQTALHLCTRHKFPKCMALLLRQLTPGEIDDQDKNKRTALHWAASYGNLDHVKMLIKQDSNIGIPDTEGKTPLHWAASSRDRDAETTPSVINWQDYEGRTALHLAVADGNESVVKVLTTMKNCNVSALDNVFRTPLHWAAVLGHSKVVTILLDSEADSSSSDANGATALHYAAQNNYNETVSVFLRRNCTDEADLEGRTAFMWAAGKGADDVIRIFLEHKVDIHQEDKTGGTALHAAALSGHSTTVKLLLKSGAKLEVTDQARHTPLFRACEMGQMDVVQTLIDWGARVDVLDQNGRSPLHWAALGGHAYICQILIKYGLQPNVRDHSARTPLHCAAYGGYVNCMSALMEHGAEPNSQDKEGMTCLHWACSKGHLDAVKLLIECNAFPNHMEFTEDRYTPLDYALMGEHHDVVQYMIEQGALSITGIQDIAAQKIQSAFKGYRVRKAFIERKKLLMKHEKLKKEAARKRAAEESKRYGDDILQKRLENSVSHTYTQIESDDYHHRLLNSENLPHLKQHAISLAIDQKKESISELSVQHLQEHEQHHHEKLENQKNVMSDKKNEDFIHSHIRHHQVYNLYPQENQQPKYLNIVSCETEHVSDESGHKITHKCQYSQEQQHICDIHRTDVQFQRSQLQQIENHINERILYSHKEKQHRKASSLRSEKEISAPIQERYSLLTLSEKKPLEEVSEHEKIQSNKTSFNSIKLTESNWQQDAAVTIQRAWRRRKLLQAVIPSRHSLLMAEKEILTLKPLCEESSHQKKSSVAINHSPNFSYNLRRK